jgi:nucleoside-diphosphate-sugar epimerase
MKVAVSGSSSVIGENLIRVLEMRGHDVIRLERQLKNSVNTRQFDLKKSPTEGLLEGIDTLIHLAWDRSDLAHESTNVSGSRMLFERAYEDGVSIVNISTISALSIPGSRYSLQKRAVEQIGLDLKATNLRLGLVWGGSATPIFKNLKKIANLPFALIQITPDPLMYTSNLGSTVSAIADIVNSRKLKLGSTLNLVADSPIPLNLILQNLRKRPAHKNFKIPVRVIEKIGMSFSSNSWLFSSVPDSALSLIGQPNTVDTGNVSFPDYQISNFIDWLKKISFRVLIFHYQINTRPKHFPTAKK